MQIFDLIVRRGRPTACRVRVGRGSLDVLVEDLAQDPPAACLAIVSDSNVAPLYGEPIRLRLRQRGIEAHLISFRAGEAEKTRETKSSLEDQLFGLGAGRDAAILAIGGGVTSDLAGFLAATWHRGVPVIQAPTSLLAMVDAAMGGKTAVNLPGGKNLVGAFLQPSALYADVATLATLPDTELLGGFAEIVKSAVIADAGLFAWIEGAVSRLRARDLDALEQVILACLKIKARVVVKDERESGRRAILNFGHTVAHAIEAASEYTIPHGPAVALGLAVEARLAVGATGLPSSQALRIARLLQAFGLSTGWPSALSVEDVVTATRRDKKARAGGTMYALPRRLGRMLPGNSVTVSLGEESLRRAIEEGAIA